MSSSTKQDLAASLIDLLSRKTLDKITVRDITDNCGVNRQTFYYHFKDVYDLLEWSFETSLGTLLQQEHHYSSWKEMLLDCIDVLQEKRTLLLNACRSINSHTLRRYLIRTLSPVTAEFVEHALKGRKLRPDDKQFLVDLYTFSIVGFLLEWMDENMTMNYEPFLDRFFLIMDGNMESSIQRLLEASKEE